MHTKEGHQSPQNDIPICGIRTPSHLTPTPTPISSPYHHRNPSPKDDIDVAENNGAWSNDVNKENLLRFCN